LQAVQNAEGRFFVSAVATAGQNSSMHQAAGTVE